MKFLIILSVVVLYAHDATSTFGHGSKSGSASGSGGLGGIGSLLAIPLGIKKQLLVSHQTRINKHFDHIINTLNKFSSSFGGGASSSAGAGAEVGATGGGEEHAVDGQGGGLSIVDSGASSGSGFDNNFVGGGATAVDFSSGSSSTSSGSAHNFDVGVHSGGGNFDVGVGGSNFDVGVHSGANFDTGSFSGGAAQSGSNVQTFHPQPAPQVQYKEVPITVHLYQVETAPIQAEPVVQFSQPAPIAPAVETQTFTRTEVVQPIDSYGTPVISQPTNTYGPPDYHPPAPVSPQNTYLPPCHDARHRHRH